MNKVPLHERATGLLGKQTQFSSATQIADELAEAANDGDELALRWIARIERYGVTLPLLRDLETAATDVQIVTRVYLNQKLRRFEWVKEFADDKAVPTLEAAYALMLITVIGTGLVDRLKRCRLKKCRKYFFGDPRATWCSETCGSLYRVTKKRNPAKARRMI